MYLIEYKTFLYLLLFLLDFRGEAYNHDLYLVDCVYMIVYLYRVLTVFGMG